MVSGKSTKSKNFDTGLFESLENRQMMAVSALKVVGINIAKSVDNDGTALNSNRISVAFGTTNSNGKVTYGNISLLDTAKIRTWGYAEDLANPGQQRKVTVGITVSAVGTNAIQIVTDRLIRKGSRLFIDLGAIKDSGGNDVVFDGSSAATTITFTKGQNKPRYTMSNRNWFATDNSYFTKDVFSAAPTPATASSEPSTNTVRANLLAFMNAKVSKGIITQAKANAAMALFDTSDATLLGILHNQNIRAAIASLYGTVAENVIASFTGTANVTGKRYTVVEFSAQIANSAPIGETKIGNPSGRLLTYIRPTFAGEDFRALSAVLAHEAMHQDATGNSGGNLNDLQEEEIIANWVQTNVYMQQALVDSSFLGNGTGLVNELNNQVLAILNSGDTLFPYGGVKRAPAKNNDGNVFVGAKTDPGNYGDNTTVKSFEDWVRRQFVARGFTSGNTPMNAVANTTINNIIGGSATFTNFSNDVIALMDNSNTILTDSVYIKLAEALKLNF